MNIKKVILASDHAGFRLKAELKRFLENKGYICEDIGPYMYRHEDDYPDYIIPAAEKVAKADRTDSNAAKGTVRGIVIGWSGQGEAIAANKVRGVRAAVYCGQKIESIILARKHNDANVLSIGAHFVSAAAAKKAVQLWLETAKSSHPRHARRLRKIAHYEKSRRA